MASHFWDGQEWCLSTTVDLGRTNLAMYLVARPMHKFDIDILNLQLSVSGQARNKWYDPTVPRMSDSLY